MFYFIFSNALPLLRQTLKYLEFLTLSDSNKYQGKFDTESFINNPGDIVYKILGIDDTDESKRSPNIILNKKVRRADTGDDISIAEENSNDIENLKSLLRQEDLRGEKSKTRIRSKMKRIKTSSKNLLSRKVSALKSKLSDESQDPEDPRGMSVSQSYSDFTFYTPSSSARSSVADIKSILKGGRFRKPKFQRSTSDGVGMAALLVRTLMTAPSLDSIAETHDSPKNSPTKPSHLKCESMVNLQTKSSFRKDKDTLLPDLASSPAEFKISDSNLSSNYSASTCSMSSSSEDTEGDDGGASETTENEIVLIDADTVSMVVKSVLAKDEAQLDANSWIQPSQNQDESDDEMSKEPADHLMHERRRLIRQSSFDGAFHSHSTEDLRKSIKTGTSRMMNPNKKGSNMGAYIVERDTNAEMLENILSTSPDADVDEESWIQPGSTTDEPDVVDTRRGSLFHDFRENISEKFHHLQEHMHHGHHNEIKHKHGLVATAMDTMLLEQAGYCGAQCVSPALNEVLKEEKRSGSYDSLKKLFSSPFRKRTDSLEHKKGDLKSTTGLVDTAMKTMLMETANIIEGVGIHPESVDEPETETTLEIVDETHRQIKPKYKPKEKLKDKPLGDESPELLDEPQILIDEPQILIDEPTAPDSLDAPNSPATPITTDISPSLESNNRNKPKMPVVVLSKCSNDSMDPIQPIRPILPKSPTHLSNELLSVQSPYLNKPAKKSKKTISCDLNNHNKTNKHLLLAPKPYSSSRNGNVVSSPTSKNAPTAFNAKAHSRNESMPSPTKGGANSGAPITSASQRDKDKDGKDASGRRSSDSELSITPKGMFCQNLFHDYEFMMLYIE